MDHGPHSSQRAESKRSGRVDASRFSAGNGRGQCGGAHGCEPRLLRADAATTIIHPKAKADSCILLWMGGGMAAPETFDPKRYQPFEVGLPVDKVMSTFPAIDTRVDNIKISKGLENVAGVMDRATLIRSHFLPDLGHILHSRHQYHWHTGYVPPQTVAAPQSGRDGPRAGADQSGDAAVH